MTSGRGAVFQFKFRLLYDEQVEKQIYDVQRYDLIIQDHTLQLKSAERLMCLLCGDRISLPITREILKKHFATHALDKNVNEHAFNFYHKTFFGLPAHLQLQQIYFDPFDTESVHCSICTQVVKAKKVEKHIQNNKHLEQMAINQLLFWKVEAYHNICENEQIVNECSQISQRNEDATPTTSTAGDKNNEQVLETEEIVDVIHKSGKLTICLVCQANIGEVEVHFASPRHKKYMRNEQKVKHVKEFHYMWNTHYAKFKENKKYFTILSSNAYRCLICNDRVLISHVPEHVLSFPCSFLHQDNAIYDDSHDWSKLRSNYVRESSLNMVYEDAILKKFYHPKDLFDRIQIMDGLNVYTMQRRADKIFCFLCHIYVCILKDNTFDEELIKAHIKTAQHKNCSHTKNHLNSLFGYHNFLLKAKPKVQLLQHLINPCKTKFKCACCKKKFVNQELIKHLEAGCSQQHNQDSSDKEQQQQEQEQSITIQNAVNLESEPDSDAEDDVVDDDDYDFCYDDETIIQIYPASNTPKGLRRPPILTIQKRSAHEKYCLACNVIVQGRASDHVDGAKHDMAVKESFDIVKAYHDFWMVQTPEVQLDQIYFNPATMHDISCAICNKVLTFEAIENHACMDRMKKLSKECLFPEEYRNFTTNYHGNTMRRLFFGLHYDVTRDFFQTMIPLSYQYRAHFFCLICTNRKQGKIYRDPCLWKRHVCRHSKQSTERDDTITHIVAFHEYWGQQTPERQLYLMHFTIQSRTSLLCSKGHLVPLNKAVEHIESDDICTLSKISFNESFHNDQMPKQENNMTLSEVDLNGQGNGTRNRPKNNQQKQRQRQQPQKETFDKEFVNENEAQEHVIELLFPETQSQGNGSALSLQLPSHLQQHKAFLAEVLPTGRGVSCSVCQEIMLNEIRELRHHLDHDQHKKNSRLGNKVRYYCEICPCNEKKEGDWLTHLDSGKHIKTIQRLGESRKDVTEYICLTCNIIIFGDKISLMRHKAAYGSNNSKHKPGTLTVGIKEILNTRRKIEEKAKSLMKECIAFEAKTQPKVAMCLQALETLLKANYPDVKIHKFGSCATGFINEDSDLDLFIDLDNTKYNGESHESREQQKIVIAVKKLLKNESKIFTDLHAILSARVPIIKVIHRQSEIDCDLSFANGLSVENTRLIKFYSDYEPAFHQAMLLLKEWGAQTSPKLKNDMTSYALCMMLIFIMQVDGILPSVQKLREYSTFDVVNINGWDTIDYSVLKMDELRESTKKAGSVADVVSSFYKYYGNFKFDVDVACPLLGKTFKVGLFENKGENLPVEMVTYKVKVAKDPDAQFRCTCNMFVQDPFDLGHNVTKNVNKIFVNNFKKICKLSFEFASRK